MENFCPVCFEQTTNAHKKSSQEYQKVFQCFLNLFEISNPALFEKRFIFCQECEGQLSLVYELEEVLEDTDEELKESKQMLRDKFKSSEGIFQSSGVYERDMRYSKLRGECMKKGKTSLV